MKRTFQELWSGPPRGDITPADEARRSLQRLLRGAFALTVGLALTLSILRAIRIFHVGTLWDDAYMFVRYAKNLLHDRRLAWNPGGEPTYGLTSLALLIVAVPVVAVFGQKPALAATLVSAIPGFVFLALLLLLLTRYVDADRAPRRAALVLTLLILAGANTTDHFASGMDTTLALAFMCAYLIAAHRAARAPTTNAAVVLGVLGGLAYFVRPELLLYATLLPASMLVFSPDRQAKRGGAVALGVTVLLVALELGACAAYFHSALPLPFYAKSTSLYGPKIVAAYRGVSSLELFAFASGYWPLFLVIALDAIHRFRARGIRSSPIEKGALAASVLLIGYHWLVVLPVMHYASRFYQPVVPALAYLTAAAFGRWARSLETASLDFDAKTASALALGALIFAWYQMAPPLLTTGKDFFTVCLQHKYADLDIEKHAASEGPRGYWYGLDQFMKLPDDLVIATTEVGMPGALSPKKTIIDLAGLNETEFARKPFSAERLFSRWHPDLIYMPHSVYPGIITKLEESPEMKGYDVYSRAELGTTDFGLAIRKDSPHYAAMKGIMGKKKPSLPTPVGNRAP